MARENSKQDPATGTERVPIDENKAGWNEYLLPFCEQKTRYQLLEDRTQKKVREDVVDRLYALSNLEELSQEQNQKRLDQLTSGFIDTALAEIGGVELPLGISTKIYNKAGRILKEIAGEDYPHITNKDKNNLIRDIYADALERKAKPENIMEFMRNGLTKEYVQYLPEEDKQKLESRRLNSQKPNTFVKLAVGGAILGSIILGAGIGISMHKDLGKIRQKTPTEKTSKLEKGVIKANENAEANTSTLYKVDERVSYVEDTAKETKEKLSGLDKKVTRIDSQLTAVTEDVKTNKGALKATTTTLTEYDKKAKELETRVEGNEEIILDNDYRLIQIENANRKLATAKPKAKPNSLFQEPEEPEGPEKEPMSADDLLKEIAGPQPAEKPVEQPEKEPENVYNPEEESQVTTASNASTWRFFVAPQVGMKFALQAEEKPDPMVVGGIELGFEKGNLSLFGRYLRGELKESKKTDIAHMKLKSVYQSFETGFDWALVNNDTGKFTIGPVIKYQLEDNTVTGRILNHEIDKTHQEKTIGVGLQAGLRWNLNNNISLGVSGDITKNLNDGHDDSNTDLDGILKAELRIKF